MTSPSTNALVETKVVAGTVGGALSSIVTWLLTAFVFGDIPIAVQSAISVLIVALSVFLSGYVAPHTARSDPAAKPASDVDPYV